MSTEAVWAGIVVAELQRSIAWYEQHVGCRANDHGDGWTSMRFANATTLELHEGDPRRAGLTFPSYSGEHAPSVMPGYGVDEPDALAEGLTVARWLPDWIVVVAPDGLRVVLTQREVETGPGLIGFRFRSPEADNQQDFLAQLGIRGSVSDGEEVEAVPLIAGPDAGAERILTDPDGTTIAVVPAGNGRPP